MFLDELSGPCGIAWSATDPLGNQLFSDSGMCGGDPGVITLPETGTYEFVVTGEGSATGTYSFHDLGCEPGRDVHDQP